jgi:exonuclease III
VIALNWNILNGGTQREEEITKIIIKYNTDLVILTEFRNNEYGKSISNKLDKHGYTYQEHSSYQKNKNGVGVFAKKPLRLQNTEFVYNENILEFEFCDFNYIGVFCANEDVTRSFIEYVENRIKKTNEIIIGDLNTGPQGSNIERYKDLNRIVEKGYVDIWRRKSNPACWSFQSKTGKSQPDHALCSENIYHEGCNIKYDLQPIEANISDHGIMILEL